MRADFSSKNLLILDLKQQINKCSMFEPWIKFIGKIHYDIHSAYILDDHGNSTKFDPLLTAINVHSKKATSQ